MSTMSESVQSAHSLPRVSSATSTTSPSQHWSSHSSAAAAQNPFLLPRDDVFLLKEKNMKVKAEAKAKLAHMKIWDKPSRLSDFMQSGGVDSSPSSSSLQLVEETKEASEPFSGSDREDATSSNEGTSTYLQRVQARAVFLASSGNSRAMAASLNPSTTSSINAATAFFPNSNSSTRRHSDQVNMSTFISQKRDMFLLNMSLSTKRNEIEKLESKALMKEEALRKAELMLEEDAMRFDAFLKENDRKAHESLKRAEKEAKEKNECLMEMKKLNADIGKVENEMHKLEETLAMQLKYKEFLDSLTPKEFLQTQAARRRARRKERKRRAAEALRASKRSDDGSAANTARGSRTGGNGGDSHRARNGMLGIDANRTKGQSTSRSQRTGGQHASSLSLLGGNEASSSGPASPRSSNGNDSHRSNVAEDDAQDSDEDDADSDDEASSMYFTHPAQLLDLFSQLEERNLFLIQNVQETEENLEELRHKFNELDAEMAEKATTLTDNIQQLRIKIEKEEERSAQLRRKKELMGIVAAMNAQPQTQSSSSSSTSAATSSSAAPVITQSSSDWLLDGLVDHVRAVHSKCGFDGDAATDTLDALRDVESWLEHLLDELKLMDPVKVESAEKKKNAERRTLIREAKRQEQQRLYEERLAKSAARANAEVVRRVGKPPMFRSAPLKKKKREENVQMVNEEEEETKRFFSV